MRLLFLALAFFTVGSAQAEKTVLPCKSAIQDWNALIPAQLSAKTCQLSLSDTTQTSCEKYHEWEDRDGNVHKNCISYITVSWTKSAKLVCGGTVFTDGQQTCLIKIKNNEDYFYDLASVFIEQLAVRNFHLVNTEASGSRLYFEKR